MAYYGGNAAYVDDGTYNDEDRNDYDYDAADDDDYIENAVTAPVERSARKSTKGRQLKRWDCKSRSLRRRCQY